MEDDPEFGTFDGVFYTRGSFSAAKWDAAEIFIITNLY